VLASLRRAAVIAASLVSACGALIGAEDDSPPDDGATPSVDAAAVESSAPDAAVDAARDGGCGSDLACDRYVFVTAASMAPTFGSLEGADGVCLAAAAPVPKLATRAFRAWLSDSVTDAKSRFRLGTGAYKRTDETIVANNFADLVDGQISMPIDHDQNGDLITTSAPQVWTGTHPNGTTTFANCKGWTLALNGLQGTIGDLTQINGSWSETGQPGDCAGVAHLFCIEY
jgi:hypothetical protein